mmetsp:Transcript_15892/g.43347  ORF Transcript_15892/g.43347 Transcript_15892/m.43347 type:complete len:243 (+) Transcript_15892:230-958(+)
MGLAMETLSNCFTAWPDISTGRRRRVRTTRQPLGFSASVARRPGVLNSVFAITCWSASGLHSNALRTAALPARCVDRRRMFSCSPMAILCRCSSLPCSMALSTTRHPQGSFASTTRLPSTSSKILSGPPSAASASSTTRQPRASQEKSTTLPRSAENAAARSSPPASIFACKSTDAEGSSVIVAKGVDDIEANVTCFISLLFRHRDDTADQRCAAVLPLLDSVVHEFRSCCEATGRPMICFR